MTESSLTAKIRELEELLLSPSVRRSSGDLDSLLSDDFLEFGSSGSVWAKEQVLKRLPSESARQPYSISEFQVEPLGDGFALATYRLDMNDASGKESRSLRSSVWASHLGGWKLLFHQGTSIP